ncbi:MAG: T9SS type A sorting domain-containing protein [Bacteroidales bacterium]|nr:T9SS type A sorting domain-containing protein [Bacteroidales bacterium]
MKKTTIILAVFITMTISTKAQWTKQTSGTSKNLWGASFVNQDLGFVCGDSGVILKTTNGGTNWAKQISGTTYSLGGLQFIDASTGYAIDFSDAGAKLLKTTSGGSNWINISLNIMSAHSGGIWFFAADTGLLSIGDGPSYSNSRILKTTNGGVSWDTVYKSAGTGWLSYFYFPDRKNGYATVSESRVLKTTDGGNNWTLLNNLTGSLWMSGVYFFNKDTGFVGGGNFGSGGGSIFKTTDGGSNWQTQPNTYGTAVMLFTATDIGYAIGANATWTLKKIIKTTNGGADWACDTVLSSGMNGITFPNANIGFAVGDSGKIFKYTNPSVGISNESSISKMTVVYPNPANDIVTLNIHNSNNGRLEIKIYDITGTLVKSETLKQNQQQINVSDLSNGIYMVSIKSKDFMENQKLIIQR